MFYNARLQKKRFQYQRIILHFLKELTNKKTEFSPFYEDKLPPTQLIKPKTTLFFVSAKFSYFPISQSEMRMFRIQIEKIKLSILNTYQTASTTQNLS